MTLTMLAKISAAYIGLAVTFATAATLYDAGQGIADEYDIRGAFLTAENGSSG